MVFRERLPSSDQMLSLNIKVTDMIFLLMAMILTLNSSYLIRSFPSIFLTFKCLCYQYVDAISERINEAGFKISLQKGIQLSK